jgi:RNA polymerase sigma factor (sigma-70 family)
VDTDLPLIEAIQSGDETALETLMERHQTALYYFVLRYTGNEHAAQEVVQETFVKTYFKAASFRPRSTVKTWIYTIALNLCRDAGRRRARRPDFVLLGPMGSDGAPGIDVADDAATADEQAARSEELEQLQAAIDRLPAKLRIPLVLCLLEQRSQKEAAEILSTTPKTIELRICRAKKKLTRMLGSTRVIHNSP